MVFFYKSADYLYRGYETRCGCTSKSFPSFDYGPGAACPDRCRESSWPGQGMMSAGRDVCAILENQLLHILAIS
ncbi:hypothetical protein CFR79_09370 [Komagataeibacter saccharivorans]|nr:hypothetical protein CFR79_09370 [Komagataeibacter saccharivorans]